MPLSAKPANTACVFILQDYTSIGPPEARKNGKGPAGEILKGKPADLKHMGRGAKMGAREFGLAGESESDGSEIAQLVGENRSWIAT